MKIRYRTDVLLQWVNAVYMLADGETKISLGRSGISCSTTDPAHVAYVDARLGYNAVDVFIPDEPTVVDGSNMVDQEAVIDISELLQAVKWAWKNKSPVATLEVDDKHRPYVRYQNRVRKLTAYDPTGYSQTEPPTIWHGEKDGKDHGGWATLTMRSADLITAIKEIVEVSDHVEVKVDPDGLTFGSWNVDGPGVDVTLPRDLLEEHTCRDKVRALFPGDYMTNMTKVCSAPIIKLMVQSDYPIQFDWEISRTMGTVYMALAPRIESE